MFAACLKSHQDCVQSAKLLFFDHAQKQLTKKVKTRQPIPTLF